MESFVQKDHLNLLLAGDAMLGRLVNKVIKQEGPEYPLEPIASLTRAADRFMVNLECAITAQDLLYSGSPKAFYFRADPIAVETLTFAGVDLVSLANNHALDAGDAGLLDTLAILDEKGIAYAGAGENLASASRPAYLEQKGQSIGVLSYCDHQADFAAGVDRPGIRYIDLTDPASIETLTGEVQALAAEVDHAIVAFHWMPNWVHTIPPFYRWLAHGLVEAGARVVWGHSPHHFLGAEWIGDGVIVYSTGGLVDDYALEPDFRNDRQLLFQASLSAQGVEQISAFPIELDFSRAYPAGPEARKWIAQRFRQCCVDVGSKVEEVDGWLRISSTKNMVSEPDTRQQ